MEFSVSPGSENTAEITVPPAFNTPDSDIDPFRSTTTTVSEKSTLTTSSTTLDKVLQSHEHLPITTRDSRYIDSLTTTTLGTTVLGTTVPGTQEGETTAAPLTPTTTSTKSNPSDTHHNTDTQTSSHPAQPTSGVGTTPATDPSTSNPTATPLVLKTPGKDIGSSMYMTTTVSEKSTLTTSSTTLDKVLHSHEHLPTTTITTSDSSHIASLTTTTLGTTVLEKTVPETQEDKTITVLTTPTKSNPSALVLSNSGTTKSSAMTWARKYSQNSSPGAKTCALDEYPVSIGVCKCNDSYYAHSELSRELVTLHCWQQNIEVALSLCFLETHHWILREGAFSGCSSISKVEQGRRVQAFMLKKKEGTCGLRLSTNISHALYSLEVGLVQVLPGINNTVSTKFGFSCAYPLVVNVSQMLPNLVDPLPTIHIPSTGDTIVIMSIFTDSQLSTPLKNRTVPLGMTLYVVLKATNSDPDRFALVVNEVFASTNISKTGAVKATHHFVNKSCPVGSQLLDGLPDNGASLQVTLVFKLFRFLKSDTLYLHARVTLCDKQAGRSCQPVSRGSGTTEAALLASSFVGGALPILTPSDAVIVGAGLRRGLEEGLVLLHLGLCHLQPCSLKNSLRRSSPWKTRSREGLERGGRWIVFGPLRISEFKASSSRSSAGPWKVIFLLLVIDWMLG
ncbi:uncharacterized protein [Castor canadensis]|uniref:Uncharacterized protein n=1 Tax=Castor canadensis TaxID=51338 RepID=A0AC58N247_CASCN